MIVRKANIPMAGFEATSQPVSSMRMINAATGQVAPIMRVQMPITQASKRPLPLTKPKAVEIDLDFRPIEVSWSLDYNIGLLDEQVTLYLRGAKERRTILQNAITIHNQHKSKITNADEVASLRMKIAHLEQQLEEISTSSLLDYQAATALILKEYRQLSKPQAKVFGQKEKVDVDCLCRKTQLVEDYLEIAQEYCPLNVVRLRESSAACPLCQGQLVDQGDQYICLECQAAIRKMEVQAESTNEHDNPTPKKSSYESSWNYADIVNQFRGTFPVVISDTMLDAIRNHFRGYMNFDIKKATNYDILDALRTLKLNIWFKHINKIRELLTDRKPMNIDRYMTNILRRGELFAAIYDEVKDEDRTNFIHGLHFLWLSLKNEGVTPDIEDFCLLKSRDCELRNLETAARGFTILRKTHPELRWEIFELP